MADTDESFIEEMLSRTVSEVVGSARREAERIVREAERERAAAVRKSGLQGIQALESAEAALSRARNEMHDLLDEWSALLRHPDSRREPSRQRPVSPTFPAPHAAGSNGVGPAGLLGPEVSSTNAPQPYSGGAEIDAAPLLSNSSREWAAPTGAPREVDGRVPRPAPTGMLTPPVEPALRIDQPDEFQLPQDPPAGPKVGHVLPTGDTGSGKLLRELAIAAAVVAALVALLGFIG
jgi:hypothetical protein